MPDGQARHIVHAENGPDAEALHQAIIYHFAAAATALLRRLKDDSNRAAEIPCRSQVLGRAQQHGHVAVMPAGVHLPWNGRPVWQIGLFLDRQGVHVGTEANDRPCSLAAVDDAHHAGTPQAGHHLVTPKVAQLLLDEAGRLVDIEKKLRLLMQRAAPTSRFGL